MELLKDLKAGDDVIWTLHTRSEAATVKAILEPDQFGRNVLIFCERMYYMVKVSTLTKVVPVFEVGKMYRLRGFPQSTARFLVVDKRGDKTVGWQISLSSDRSDGWTTSDVYRNDYIEVT